MTRKSLLALSLLAAASLSAMAQVANTPAAAAQKALVGNPEVASRFDALRASVDEIDAAAAGYLPKVDLGTSVGRTQDRVTNRNPAAQGLTNAGASLTITQVLWDGLATANEVNRLSHTRMARYFDFLDTTEQISLEAVRAFHDVLRYRTLVTLAEDNYVQHKYAFNQMQTRVTAGVARGVDLEQSGARLALAESNLVTEKANLHDVIERYRRIVGEAPSNAATAGAPLSRPLPANGFDALSDTARYSPVIASAVEGLRAVRAQADVRRSAYQPRVEARLRAGGGRNFDGVDDQRRDVSGSISLTWNLFNGGADDARMRQQANLLNQAADVRDKACRDTRQVTAIAFNDVRRLNEQLVHLDRNVIAIAKARDAYRQQFDIGQRSLLDLLNAENELYTARRSYAIAVADRDIAIARTHAGMGTLVAALGLARPSTDGLAPESANWAAGEDAAGRCPLDPTELAAVSQAELDAKARALVNASPTAMAMAAAPAQGNLAVTPAPLAAPAAAPMPPAAAPVVTPSPATAATEARLREWAAAWSAKDVSRYLSYYAPDFQPAKGDKAQWQAQRERQLGKAGDISVQVSNVATRTISASRVETTFTQAYSSSNYTDRMSKTLTWELRGKDWLIISESNR